MTTITIELPDTLQQRVQELVIQRGGTIDELLQELLEEYLEEIEDMRETVEIKAHIASGEERTYPHEEVWYEEDTYPSLEEVVAKIKATPSDPSNIHLPAQSLAELLADAPDDPSFDEGAWDREWAAVEAEMKDLTRANDRAEGRA